MRFSVNWLKQWVALDLDADALAAKLTSAGLEVDAVEAVASEFNGVVVAEIEDCQPHPDADKLRVCTVADGSGQRLQIVCGAPNARAGMRVPLARVGASLGADFKIKKARLRGVESSGMLCSARELGLSDDHSGLMELPADAPLGEDVRGWLELDDASIEVDLTPNRADCLSIAGLARDVAASCGAQYTPQTIEPVAPESEEHWPIRLESPEDCPRYAGRIIRGIDPNACTPLWLTETLRRCGLRSISPVVDITNYVLLELGQPMHAFDLDRLHQGISVRRGQPGEKLTLLDGNEISLDEQVLAICDAQGPVALAGIMGGEHSAVGDGTSNILLESAWFRPSTIMGKARQFGLHTDASHRFERGVDPQGQVQAIERATALVLQICGGTPGPVLLQEQPQFVPVNQAVRLRLSRLNRLIGIPFEAQRVEDILSRLGMAVEPADGEWIVTAPPARFDIAIEEDLIEEVARIHGYDEIPAAPPSGVLGVGNAAGHAVPLEAIQHSLCCAGYQEAISYSFVDRRLLEIVHQADQALPLANPLSADMDVMRTTMLPGLLRALDRNQRRQHSRVRLFETGVVYLQADEYREVSRVAGVAAGDVLPEQWGQAGRAVDFFDIKGDVQGLLALHGEGKIAFQPLDQPWAHPGASASVELNDRRIGWCGAVHPSVLKALDIEGTVFAFELDLQPLQNREVPFAKDISRFPSIRRDLAFWVPESVSYAEIQSAASAAAGQLLQKLVVFDVYHDSKLKKGYKSVAIGLILQNVSSTLTDEQIEPVVQQVITGLEQHLGAYLRG